MFINNAIIIPVKIENKIFTSIFSNNITYTTIIISDIRDVYIENDTTVKASFDICFFIAFVELNDEVSIDIIPNSKVNIIDNIVNSICHYYF